MELAINNVSKEYVEDLLTKVTNKLTTKSDNNKILNKDDNNK